MAKGDWKMTESRIAGPAAPSRGFTFTISMLLLLVTLVAVATFSQHWRKSQQSSITEILPAQAIRMHERIASDVGHILGADAALRRLNQTAVAATVEMQFPFKKEGMPIAVMAEYANSLPQNTPNSGVESVLSANDINSSNATVMVLGGDGRLVYNNDGSLDAATLYHPRGWRPAEINVTFYCSKTASRFGNLTFSADSGSGAGYSYRVSYSDAGRNSHASENSTYLTSNASLEVRFPDGGLLRMESNFSPSLQQNFTSVSYSKSPSAILILPFDANASLASGAVRDYSPYSNNLTRGDGAAANSPAWSDDCYADGCYSFDGSNDYLVGPGLNLTESLPELSYGQERMTDGGFESVATGNPDDGISDTWNYWSITNPGGIVFDSTSNAKSGARAVKIFPGSQSNYLYQQLKILENTPYLLSFWVLGNGSRYEIYDAGNGAYLQADGSTWNSTVSWFSPPTNGSYYREARREFFRPPFAGATSVTLQIRLLPSAGGTVYYDAASLRQSAGLNGGFEYYYEDTAN